MCPSDMKVKKYKFIISQEVMLCSESELNSVVASGEV